MVTHKGLVRELERRFEDKANLEVVIANYEFYRRNGEVMGECDVYVETEHGTRYYEVKSTHSEAHYDKALDQARRFYKAFGTSRGVNFIYVAPGHVERIRPDEVDL